LKKWSKAGDKSKYGKCALNLYLQLWQLLWRNVLRLYVENTGCLIRCRRLRRSVLRRSCTSKNNCLTWGNAYLKGCLTWGLTVINTIQRTEQLIFLASQSVLGHGVISILLSPYWLRSTAPVQCCTLYCYIELCTCTLYLSSYSTGLRSCRLYYCHAASIHLPVAVRTCKVYSSLHFHQANILSARQLAITMLEAAVSLWMERVLH
jgi:hypothetical protein